MPSRHLVRAFLALWWILGSVLAVYGVETAWHSFHSAADRGASVHVAALASVEAVAALLFLIPFAMRTAGAALLVVFALAFILHAVHGEFASQLLLDPAGVAFIMVHGRVPMHLALGKGAADAWLKTRVSGEPGA